MEQKFQEIKKYQKTQNFRIGINYRILPDFNLIIECIKGHATSQDAINLKQEVLANKLYDPDFNVIVDLSDFYSFVNTTNTEPISNFINFLKAHKIKGKVAMLTSKPNQVVLCQLIKKFSLNLPIDFEIFSTTEAAIKFVGCSLNKFTIIDEFIRELNNNTIPL